MRDFPAAHSMDTTWFAVDAAGNVGIFDTGEDGALPERAVLRDVDGAFDTLLFQAAQLAAALVENPGLVSTERVPRRTRPASRCVVVVDARAGDGPVHHRRSPAPPTSVEEDDPAITWSVVREKGPRVLASKEKLGPSTVSRLEGRTDVISVLDDGDLYDVLDGAPGVFQFRHRWEEGAPGSYERDGEAPVVPLTVSDLPPAERALMEALTLPIRFSDAERIELADHLEDEECQMWAEGTTLRGDAVAVPSPAAPAVPPKVPHRADSPSNTPRAIVIPIVLFLVVVLYFMTTRGRS